VGTLIHSGLADIPGASAAAGSGDVGLSALQDAPAPIRELIRVSYGDATGRIFLISALLSVITIVAILFIREVALRTQSGNERLQGEVAGDTTAAVDDELAASSRTSA
jgi:hypothetical protein